MNYTWILILRLLISIILQPYIPPALTFHVSLAIRVIAHLFCIFENVCCPSVPTIMCFFDLKLLKVSYLPALLFLLSYTYTVLAYLFFSHLRISTWQKIHRNHWINNWTLIMTSFQLEIMSYFTKYVFASSTVWLLVYILKAIHDHFRLSLKYLSPFFHLSVLFVLSQVRSVSIPQVPSRKYICSS